MRHLKKFESYDSGEVTELTPQQTKQILSQIERDYTPEECVEWLKANAPEALEEVKQEMGVNESRRYGRGYSRGYGRYQRMYENLELTPEEERRAEKQAIETLGIIGISYTFFGAVTAACGAFSYNKATEINDYSWNNYGDQAFGPVSRPIMIGVGIAAMIYGAYKFYQMNSRSKAYDKRWG